MKVEAVVLANGEYPTAPLPLQILADAPYVVCCDGGADEYIRNGHTPNLIIGDGDSISEENRKKYGHLLHRIAEQETNDQTKAVNYLLSQGKRRTRTFPSHPGQQVSIINFNARKLHGLGLVYPLSDFTNWWQGTLNECIGTEFTIEAEGEYLVFLNFPQPLPQSTR